jgi:uncharacterized protein YcgL (UPF0745 family)
MLCAIYKSSKKQETYLYVPGRDDFSKVPEALIMPLKKDRKLGQVHIDKLRCELKIKGFYLQLPPPTENLLKTHLQQQNLD